MTPSNC